MKTRLFKYPLSYMIYDPAFDALPDAAKQQVYSKLFDVLTGKDSSERFARLAPQDRSAILEILRETKPDLPAYWRAAAQPKLVSALTFAHFPWAHRRSLAAGMR